MAMHSSSRRVSGTAEEFPIGAQTEQAPKKASKIRKRSKQIIFLSNNDMSDTTEVPVSTHGDQTR